jgi:drug/metabolite transporter (DMT)-like permease
MGYAVGPARMTPYARAQVQIHVCVVLWGFTAVLGRAITLAALPLVFWRMLAVTILLLLVPRVRRSLAAMPPRDRLTFAGIGAVVAIHWLSFYASIKHANASVAATCIALAPVFLSVVEPWLTKRPFDRRELALGLFVVPGVVLVVGGVPQAMRLGLVFGVFSAFFVAVFAALNKLHAHRGDPLGVTCVELGAGALLLLALSPVLPHDGPAIPVPGLHDLGLIVVLAVACTLLPFALSLVALRELSAFAAQLAVNLEPVYSIVLAALLLGERRELGGRFYGGVAVVLAAVFVHPLLARRPVLGEAAQKG